MSDLSNVTIFVGVVLAVCMGIGVFTKFNIDRKNKPHKKLSKKQKRELNERL